MESQPQNPEFRNTLENFHSCILKGKVKRKTQCAFKISRIPIKWIVDRKSLYILYMTRNLL